jgi:hypothetical protein
MLNKKALSFILGLSFILFGVGFLSIGVSPKAHAIVTADSGGTNACSKLSGTYNSKCNLYLVNLDKCQASDTACQTAAFKSYISDVCGTTAACKKDATKVITQQVVSAGPSVASIYPTSQNYGIDNNPIIIWLKRFINLFAAIVGVGSIVMVTWGGLQYAAARDNPQAIQAARTKIANVVIGLAAFIFLYAFIQWLIPGGAF